MVQPKNNPQTRINGDYSKELYNMSHRSKDTTGSGSGNSGKSSNKTNGTSSNFRTDSAISANHNRGERTLQRWVAPTGPNDVDMSLEGSSNGGGGQWDQFAANEKKFGITTDYDERFYTTAIDKSNPDLKARYAKADKIAKEIERSAPTTSHQAEERKMDYVGGNDAGGDEEDKYSGVKRQDQPAGNRENKYMPPAKRAPAGASTVKGAPVDPAIISSQLKTSKPQPTPRQEENKAQATSSLDPPSTTAVPASHTTALIPESKLESAPKLTDIKATSQTSTPLKPSTATSRTISPQANDAQGAVPSATSTVTADVLKEFKHFATQQRANADKIRVNKAKADKEVKLSELKRFADNFKLPTPVPSDLIGIIAKDPAKQREIQEKAQRDANEIAKRKADEAAAKDRKGSASKESQANAASAAPSDNRNPRPANNASTNGPQSASRNQTGRMVPPYPQFQNNRPNPQHMGPLGRQGGGLSHRLRESHKSQSQEARMPPTGPANPANAPFPHRMGGPTGHLGTKFNPNSHEFRPNAYAPSFSPNRHTSAGSSPRSAINNANDAHAPGVVQSNVTIAISKKKRTVDPKQCSILAFAKSVQPPEGKNWSDNGDLRPAYDTLPTWRSATDDEKSDSTMLLDCKEYFERQPFNAQPTPNPPNLLPQHVPHQHQLPLHMQQNVGLRHSPHAPHVQLHGGQHTPVPHTSFNGADDHRMMHSSSQNSYTQSPRIGHQMPLGYPTTMHSTPQMPYGQHMMGAFMGPGGPQINNFSNRSLSNSGQYMPQQPGTMGAPIMMQQQFMNPGMMGGPPQMPMYPTGQPFIPPGAAPQSMPAAANGYPSPRPSAPMMVHQGSQQGQAMYGQSPNMSYQQPYAPQQGQMTNIRASYNGASAQQYGSSPQQMHQYTGPPHRNGNNNFNKNYQGHGHHHGPSNHAAPTGPQGRSSDGTDEAK
ncbi:hypothetical protein GGR57DRAFT_360147 [Xylariaceae sp. FL1272]|nr:hypothetical protein GGR57DRAFT_360147 [Xylariaceae sp. FL1272]